MTKIASSLTELIGNTPLLALKKWGPDLPGEMVAKLEFFNPGSSVKDRIGLAMIEDAEQKGFLKPGSTIIEPTSGNTGIGLAMVAAIKGYKIILVMPESMSVERRKLLSALGAQIVLTDAQEGMAGAMDQAKLLCSDIQGAFMPQQFNNPANPEIHYRTTGPEIWKSCQGKIDYIVAGVGTGGTISGVGKYLKEKNPAIKCIAVEPEESAVMSGDSPGPHMIQGIGAGFIPENMNLEIIDEVVKITSEQAINTAKKIIESEGLIIGISSGANAAAAQIIAARPESAGKRIVVIFPDTGERYISTLLFYQD